MRDDPVRLVNGGAMTTSETVGSITQQAGVGVVLIWTLTTCAHSPSDDGIRIRPPDTDILDKLPRQERP